MVVPAGGATRLGYFTPMERDEGRKPEERVEDREEQSGLDPQCPRNAAIVVEEQRKALVVAVSAPSTNRGGARDDRGGDGLPRATARNEARANERKEGTGCGAEGGGGTGP